MFAATSIKARAEEFKGAMLEPPNKIVQLKVNEDLAAQLWTLSERVVEQVLADGTVLY